MAISQEFRDAMSRLDRETSETAAKFRKMEQIISTNMSQEDVDEVKAFLLAIADRNDALGNDPENPVPEEPAPEFNVSRRK